MMSVPVLMDISRLLSRAGSAIPTGIDRVELEYALFLSRHFPGQVDFVAYHPLGRIGVLPRRMSVWFLRSLASGWARARRPGRATVLMARILVQAAAAGRVGETERRRRYLLLSHHHLMERAVIARFLARANAGLSVMVHDLIPIEFPEYARPREPERHRRRMDTVGALADVAIVPSQAVAESLRDYLGPRGRCPPVGVVHHGCLIDPGGAMSSGGIAPDGPYFVMLGTIEPRKNHLLLLNLWRQMSVGRDPAQMPHLLVIGRRGWENENVLDMIERCPALQGVVHEHATLPDQVVADLLRGARALLFPSFAEGFGLPLLEALALNTPCLCSDLPVFREIAGDLPCYLDPLDGPGWQSRILELTDGDARRAADTRPVFADWPTQVVAGLSVLDGMDVAG
jgi:glycosyltransferase involved in cell wall biosynthesis